MLELNARFTFALMLTTCPTLKIWGEGREKSIKIQLIETYLL